MIRLSVFLILGSILLFHSKVVNGANIALFCVQASRSHTEMFYPIADELVKRGHNVTFYTSFKPMTKRKELKEIIIESYSKHVLKKLPPVFTKQGRNDNFVQQIIKLLLDTCPLMYEDKAMQDLVKSDVLYDVTIQDASMHECFHPLLQNKSKSVIYLGTTGSDIILNRMWQFNIPVPFSYVVNGFMLDYSSGMSFFQRLVNVISSLSYIYGFNDLVVIPSADNFLQEKYPELLSFKEAQKKVPLFLINQHSAIGYAVPSAPILKPIGGVHIKDPKPLSVDLENFVSQSGDDGFIYVSFGTIVPAEDMPIRAKNAFIEAFSKIRQRVVWKFDKEISEISSNVKIVNWAPQQDLLAHPKIKAFVTHGGLFGLMEAVHYGVPIVGLPVFADQLPNIRKAVEHGFGVSLSWDTITADEVVKAINTVIHNPSYKENALKRQKLFRDNLVPPREEAAYWIEYVLRHQGSLHLRLPVDHLNLAQYFLLDVIAFVLAVVTVIIFVIYKLVGSVIKLIWRTKSKNQTSSHKKKK